MMENRSEIIIISTSHFQAVTVSYALLVFWSKIYVKFVCEYLMVCCSPL